MKVNIKTSTKGLKITSDDNEDMKFKIQISKDIFKREPQSLLKIPEKQIIETIKNPNFSESLTYFGSRLDLFLKQVDSRHLLVITTVNESQRQMDVSKAFYISEEIVSRGSSLGPSSWVVVPGPDPNNIFESDVSQFLTFLEEFLQKFGLTMDYRGESAKMFIKKEILHVTSIPPDPNNVKILNFQDHEKCEALYVAKTTDTGFDSKRIDILLSFCIDMTLYLEWVNSMNSDFVEAKNKEEENCNKTIEDLLLLVRNCGEKFINVSLQDIDISILEENDKFALKQIYSFLETHFSDSETKIGDTETWYRAGVIAHKLDWMKEAERFYRVALEHNKSNVDAWNNLGLVLKAQGRTKEGMNAFQVAFDLDPEYPYACYNLGSIYLDKEDYEESEIAFRQAMKKDPNNYEFLNSLAIVLSIGNKKILFGDKKLIEAETLFKKAMIIQPKNIGAKMNISKLFADQGRFQEAEEQLKNVVALEPQNPDGWNELGVVLKNQKKHGEALIAYKNSLKFNQNNVNAWNNLGLLFVEEKNYIEAEKAYRKAINVDPSNSNIWNSLGSFLTEQNRIDEANEALDKALEVDPTNSLAWNSKGNLLLSVNRKQDAEIAFIYAIKHDPANFIAHFNLSTIYYEQKKIDKAIQELKAVLKYNPNFFQAAYNLGVIILRLGKVQQARDIFRIAIKLEPTNPSVWNYLGVTMGHLGHRKEAEEAYKTAIRHDPSNVHAKNNLRNLLMRRG